MTAPNWMFGPRLEITLKMHLDGCLHIGSGVSKEDPQLRDEKAKKVPEVAEVQRHKNGQALIPATSLKGALRSHALLRTSEIDSPLGKSELDALLGERGEAEAGKGRIARLWLEGAIAAPLASDGFQGMTKNEVRRDQGFVKTGVRIDRQSGAAEDKYLYNREVIGPGVSFTARATLFLDGADGPALEDQLAHLLAPLASEPGLMIGGQHRQAAGRLRLDEITITRKSIDPVTLDLTAKREPELGRAILRKAQSIGPRAAHEAFRLTLTCDGPFISMRDAAKEEGETGEVTQPLKQPDGKPLLWPSSLLGALRARAAWLAEVNSLRADLAAFQKRHQGKETLDNRDKVVRTVANVADLSPVERLFGVAGWRGLVTVASLKAADNCPIAFHKMKSVTIDRFTGGGIDERLFTERVFLNPRFICDLRLEARAGQLLPSDRDLLQLLFDDIAKHGLELGHGGAKGFGWFGAEVKTTNGGASQ